MGQTVFLNFSTVPVVSLNSVYSLFPRQKQETQQVLNFVLNDVSLPYMKLNTVSTSSTLKVLQFSFNGYQCVKNISKCSFLLIDNNFNVLVPISMQLAFPEESNVF